MSSGFQKRFSQLDSLLTDLRPYWQFMPYAEKALPWNDINPALCDWLSAQTPENLESWKTDTSSLCNAISQFVPAATKLHRLCALTSTETERYSLPPYLNTGIPGRKWQQIIAFNDSLPSESDINCWNGAPEKDISEG